jgi:hypothetical protein
VHSHISRGGKIMVDCGLSTLLLEHANEGGSRLRTAVQVHSNPYVFKTEHRTLTDADHEVRNIMQNSCDERSERILHGQ